MAVAVPLEAAKTALEVADFTWMALEECRHHNLHRHTRHELSDTKTAALLAATPEKTQEKRQELESLRSENRRLRNLLEEQNLKLLEACSPGLDSVGWSSHHQVFPVSEASAEDLEETEIDTEGYVIVNKGHVVDGMANFMAQCVVSDPKAKDLPPGKLQKAITKAMEGESKLEKVVNIYTAGKKFHRWSRWGFALAGLYRSRGVLKIAAKLAIKAL